jgi:hypothetical protein
MPKLWIKRDAPGAYFSPLIDGKRYWAWRNNEEGGWWRVDMVDERLDGKPVIGTACFRLLKDADDFIRAIPVRRRNIMSGDYFIERVDTPYYLSPSSETYWSS